MATLSKFRLNRQRIIDGDWEDVAVDGEAFRIRTRGLTVRYQDRLHALHMEACKLLNRAVRPGDPTYVPETLPASVRAQNQARALSEECVLAIEDLLHDDGRQVTVEEFREMLCDTLEYPFFLNVALGAALKVHGRREETTKAVEGNSAPASAGS